MIWLGIAGGVVLGLAALILGFALWQSLRLIRPARRSLDLHPRDFTPIYEDVRFPGPAGKLAAWYFPGTNGRTLIALHGIADNRQQWLPAAADLQRLGYAVLAMDFRRHGHSDGRYATYGDHEVEDVAAAIAYLGGRGDVDGARLGVMGRSLGGITAILAAARLPALRAVMAEAAMGDLVVDLRTAFSRYVGPTFTPLVSVIVWWGQTISGARLTNIRPAESIGQIAPRPVFIIGDLADKLVDEPRTSAMLFARAGEPKSLWQIPNAGHVQAYAVEPTEYIARLDAFFRQAL